MAGYDLTTFNAAMKELYGPQTVQYLTYKDAPFLGLVKKRTDFVGKSMPIPIITGNGQGVSASFAIAQANETPVEMESFSLVRRRKYKTATIDRETMLASAKDKGAFLKAAKVAFDGAMRGIKAALANDVWGSGTGSRGVISGAPASGVITLASPEDIVRFERGMVLQASATDGATPRAALGYVIAVNRDLGTITVSATGVTGVAGDPSGWISGDYLLVYGDSNACIQGVEAWLPSVAPTGSDNFNGVNRSVDPTRLAGVRYDGSSQSIVEALVNGTMRSAREEGAADYGFINFASYAALLNELGSKAVYCDLKGPANITYTGVKLPTPHGMVTIIPDRGVKANTAKLLALDSWTLYSLDEAPHIDTADGLTMLRQNNADGVEARFAYYANLACEAPGWNAHIDLGA